MCKDDIRNYNSKISDLGYLTCVCSMEIVLYVISLVCSVIVALIPLLWPGTSGTWRRARKSLRLARDARRFLQSFISGRPLLYIVTSWRGG